VRVLPRLFTDAGEFIEPDQSDLSADAVVALGSIRNAYGAVKKAEHDLAMAETEIADAVARVTAAEAACAPWGKYDFHRLWQQNVHGI
jgi:hypothetical protein